MTESQIIEYQRTHCIQNTQPLEVLKSRLRDIPAEHMLPIRDFPPRIQPKIAEIWYSDFLEEDVRDFLSRMKSNANVVQIMRKPS